jgi:hypothetical protein
VTSVILVSWVGFLNHSSSSASCTPTDDYPTFKKVFEGPIVASRAPDCSVKARELGRARAEQVCHSILNALYF